MWETMTQEWTLKTLNKFLSAKNESYFDEELAKEVPKTSIPKYHRVLLNIFLTLCNLMTIPYFWENPLICAIKHKNNCPIAKLEA